MWNFLYVENINLSRKGVGQFLIWNARKLDFEIFVLYIDFVKNYGVLTSHDFYNGHPTPKFLDSYVSSATEIKLFFFDCNSGFFCVLFKFNLDGFPKKSEYVSRRKKLLWSCA